MVYQRRRRGRVAAEAALRVIRGSAEWDDDLAEAAGLLGLGETVMR